MLWAPQAQVSWLQIKDLERTILLRKCKSAASGKGVMPRLKSAKGQKIMQTHRSLLIVEKIAIKLRNGRNIMMTMGGHISSIYLVARPSGSDRYAGVWSHHLLTSMTFTEAHKVGWGLALCRLAV
jgi:hypothetical protein